MPNTGPIGHNAIKTQILRWRDEEDQKALLERQLADARWQAERAYDRGLTDALWFFHGDHFKAQLAEATKSAFKGWAPGALAEFGKFQSHFREDYRRPWPMPSLSAVSVSGPIGFHVNVMIPEVRFTYVVEPPW